MASPESSTYDPRAYPAVAVTVDIAVFTILDDSLRLLLVERGEEPFKESWALPGGFVRPDEDLDAAAARELEEETAITPEDAHLEQLGSYGSPERDPRMRVVTVAYWAICSQPTQPKAGTDAAYADLVPVAKIERGSFSLVAPPAAPLDRIAPVAGGDAAYADLVPMEKIETGSLPLAFDHFQIVGDALERLRSKLEYTAVAAKFCPPEFTITQLRRVYETVWDTELDPGNFQRNFRRSGLFEERVRAGRPSRGSHGGRPASLWKVRPGSGYPRLPIARRVGYRK